MLLGVDVHPDFQAGLNIERLATEGFSFVVVKATQGAGGYTSGPTFDDWITRARKAGLICGAYHWLDSSDPVRQADRFLARLASVGGPEGLLLQIDCEDTANPATADHLAKFVARMNTRTGGHPLLLYSGSWWYGPHLGDFNASALGLRLWHSAYVNGSGAVANLAALIGGTMWTPGYGGFTQATILQFTEKGSAGGLTANVDLNAFRGTRADLAALTTTGKDDGMSWDEAVTILQGTNSGGFADNPANATTPAWVRPAVAFNLKTLSLKLDALTTFVQTAAAAEKVRDATESTEIASLRAALTAVAGASTGTPLDTAAVIATAREEGQKTRDLVQRRHEDELAELKRERTAEIAGLLAEVEALKAAGNTT